MTPEDYDDVLALWRGSLGVGLSNADSREGVAAHIAANPGMSAVAREGGEIIGAVLCGADGRRGYITHLAVAEPYRRQGIGRALTDWCIDRLRERGIDKCHIFVFADNEIALAYWRAAGWTERTELKVLSKLTDSGGE
jgi:putative acetyltransferase